MKPTVSIILPVFNAESTIDRCMETILTQSLHGIEVLCVNDGSTDGTGEALSRWEKQDERVHVLRFEENNGNFPAVKAGILKSTGEYVMFVDSDDRLPPGACENAVRLIRKYEADILQFGVRINAPSAEAESIWRNNLSSNEWTSEGVNILYDCYSLHRFRFVIWNKIYRGDVCRAAAASMPDLRISINADILQTFFFLYYARTFRSVTDGPYYEYFIGNGIWTQAPTAKQFEKVCKASAILPAIEEFLRQENALENHRFLLESIDISIKNGVLSKLLALPEITKETIDLAVKTWGSEVLYDFIRYTGLLDVKCPSRENLVPTLTDRIRTGNRRSTSAGKTTLTVGGLNTAQPAGGMRPT